MAEFRQTYPTDQQIPKVVWRGGLTGPMDSNYTNPRWRLVTHPAVVHHHHNDTTKDLFDVGLTHIPSRHDRFIRRAKENLTAARVQVVISGPPIASSP